jgi:hypothetical protein
MPEIAYSQLNSTAAVRRAVFRVMAHRYNLSLQADAQRYIEQLLVEYDIAEDRVDDTIELIAQAYCKQNGTLRILNESEHTTVSNFFFSCAYMQ